MSYMEKELRAYISKCFTDAFKAEKRKFDNIENKMYSFEWILVKNISGIYQMFPIAKCKYNRVTRRVLFRLKNNLEKNFGIIYGNSEELRSSFYHTGLIDYNFTQAMFEDKYGKHISLSVFDIRDNPYENDSIGGECMPAYRFEKLLFKHWHINADIYRSLPENDRRRHLPVSYNKNWILFKDLYRDTFGVEVGHEYDIQSSSGLQRI